MLKWGWAETGRTEWWRLSGGVSTGRVGSDLEKVGVANGANAVCKICLNVQKFANINTTRQTEYMFFSADFRIYLEVLDFVKIWQWKLQQNKAFIWFLQNWLVCGNFLSVRNFFHRFDKIKVIFCFINNKIHCCRDLLWFKSPNFCCGNSSTQVLVCYQEGYLLWFYHLHTILNNCLQQIYLTNTLDNIAKSVLVFRA